MTRRRNSDAARDADFLEGQEEETQQDAAQSTIKLCAIRFAGVPSDIPLEEFLQMTVKGVDVLSAEKTSEDQEYSTIVLCFFSYFDMFRVLQPIKNEYLVGGCKVSVVPEEHGRSPSEMQRLYGAHSAGGTRNVLLCSLEDYMSAEFIREEGEKYGAICSLKHLRDRRMAYVEFFSLEAAIKFVSELREDALFNNVKITFAKDKCNPQEVEPVDGTAQSVNSRTVYFGNIPSDSKTSDVLSAVHGGDVFTIKLLREKKCAFVMFIDYISAAAFVDYASSFPVSVKGLRVKVGWGKPQPLPPQAPLMAYAGATRALKIGLPDGPTICDRLEPELRRYGEIEARQYDKDGKLRLVCYCSLADAHAAFSALSRDAAFAPFVLGYAPDPCAAVSAQDLMLQSQRQALSHSY